jgi:catechol 2,3-dioxygenase-like lactoylglutathione lyase family enzyme
MAPNGVESLAVILLLTDATKRTAAFYRDVLGLALEGQEHDGSHEHYAARLGSVYFTIQCLGDFATREPGFEGAAAGRGHDSVQLCFTVPSMDGFLQRLRALKIEPLHLPMPFEHTTFTTLRDPDGRAVRIMTPWQ